MPEISTNTDEERMLLYRSRSEEVAEIMGKIPGWITRWGITLMAAVFACFLVATYFFNYPDVIPARVTISSANPPVQIIARSSLPIRHILVEGDQRVRQGDVLCILSSVGNYSEINNIASICQHIDTAVDLRALALQLSFPGQMNLGEMQGDYIGLLQAVQEYRFFLTHNSYGGKIGHLEKQFGYQNELSEVLQIRDRKIKEQLAIQKARYTADSGLVVRQIMSRVEFEQEQRAMINEEMTTDGSYTNILQSRLQEREIQKNIAETGIELQTKENDLQQKIRQAAKVFRGSFSAWEEKFVLKAPVSGKVSFFRIWAENQFVKAGEPVMVITPGVLRYVARGDIGIAGAGKVQPGQKVLIRLIAYPYEEFGSLSGTVRSRSAVALDSVFSIEIALGQRLRTNNGRTIPDQPELEGVAEITTESKSLLARLFENLYGKRRR